MLVQNVVLFYFALLTFIWRLVLPPAVDLLFRQHGLRYLTSQSLSLTHSWYLSLSHSALYAKAKNSLAPTQFYVRCQLRIYLHCISTTRESWLF